jgi:hypothetical protein
MIFFYFKPRKISKAELKGREGEEKVIKVLKKKKVKHFNDVLLQLGNHTTQIDHLVVFPNKTVLVIETKNKDGVILGKSEDEQWTQFFPNESFRFYSPTKQNEGHIRFLHRFCDKNKIFGIHFINIVVFTSERSKLKSVPENTVHLRDFEKLIDLYSSKSFWNRSSKFSHLIAMSDQSKSKKKVKQHIQFAKQAKKFQKK